jgi:hypothetical protein
MRWQGKRKEGGGVSRVVGGRPSDHLLQHVYVFVINITTGLRVCNKHSYYHKVGESAHASPYRKKGLQGAGALVIDKGVEQYGQVSAAHFLLDVFERRRQVRNLGLLDIFKVSASLTFVLYLPNTGH